MAPEGVDVYVRYEAFNPMLSVKDRLAVGLLDWAEHHGKLRPGQPVMDTSVGGIGLAAACAQRGHPLVLVAPRASATGDWRRLMRFLGASVVLAEGSVAPKAQELAERRGWLFLQHFRAEANAWIHARSTGPEVLEALGPRQLDYFVAPHGTGGMLKGVGEVLRARSPGTRICVVEPDGLPHPDYSAMYGPHYSWPDEILQGWNTDFKPMKLEDEVRQRYVDEMVFVSGHESTKAAHELAQREFLFTGISGGALAAGALQVARRAPKGSSVLTVLLDTSPFQLSTPLLNGVLAEMSEEEESLSAEMSEGHSPNVWDVDGHY